MRWFTNMRLARLKAKLHSLNAEIDREGEKAVARGATYSAGLNALAGERQELLDRIAKLEGDDGGG
jgi:hypothetical protein